MLGPRKLKIVEIPPPLKARILRNIHSIQAALSADRSAGALAPLRALCPAAHCRTGGGWWKADAGAARTLFFPTESLIHPWQR